MTTWKNGGMYGNHLHEVTNETGNQSICYVRTRCNKYTEDDSHHKWTIVPWPAGKANFRLILQAPQMLEALEAIRDQAECYLQPLRAVGVSRARWEKVRDRAVTAIAAAKGDTNEAELV